MKLLVTGAAGFIGGNYARLALERHSDVSITAVDKLTYAGNLENLSDLEKDRRFSFVRADIASVDEMGKIFAAARYDAVVNFAAETHVDRSLKDAAAFVRTNIAGTQCLLDLCRETGVKRFLQVSTDEVYGTLGPTGKFTELTPIQPNNPYSATKAAADFMVRAARESHGLDTVITRCSNNFGPYQFPEKLIPLMIANALEDKQLPVYGDGMHVRDWIYVLDHCAAVDLVLRSGRSGEVYNIGGDHDVPNIEIVKTILKLLGKPESLIRHIADRPGHDRRYAMDSAKIRKDLGWVPEHTFESAMNETVNWYTSHRDWMARVRSGEYARYYEEMYGKRLKSGKARG